jgi:hypothetical protein
MSGTTVKGKKTEELGRIPAAVTLDQNETDLKSPGIKPNSQRQNARVQLSKMCNSLQVYQGHKLDLSKHLAYFSRTENLQMTVQSKPKKYSKIKP